MKTVLGVCKWCGQTKTIEVAESANPNEEERDELASEECDCEQAEMERQRREKIEAATEEIAEFTKNADEPQAGVILLKALPELVDRKIDGISIKVNENVTYKMKLNKYAFPQTERIEKTSHQVTK